VYKNDIQLILNKLSTKRNRNCCRKVLDYELESESEEEEEEEIEQQEVLNSYKSSIVPNESHRIGKAISPQRTTISERKEVPEKPSFHHTSLRTEVPAYEDKVERGQKSMSKPQKNNTKSKPFNIRETPKKNHSSTPHNKVENSLKSPQNKVETSQRERGKFIFENERNSEDIQQKQHKFEEKETKILSNTHDFEQENKEIETFKNEDSRKFTKNLYNIKEKNKKKLLEERNQANISEKLKKNQSKSSANPTPKLPINNSSSHSSLGNLNGIMDLGEKNRTHPPQSVMTKKEAKRHETLTLDKQQKTKPLIGKKKTDVIKRHETMNSFDGRESQNPTLTANTLVNNHEQSDSESSEEEKATVPSSNNFNRKSKSKID